MWCHDLKQLYRDNGAGCCANPVGELNGNQVSSLVHQGFDVPLNFTSTYVMYYARLRAIANATTGFFYPKVPIESDVSFSSTHAVAFSDAPSWNVFPFTYVPRGAQSGALAWSDANMHLRLAPMVVPDWTSRESMQIHTNVQLDEIPSDAIVAVLFANMRNGRPGLGQSLAATYGNCSIRMTADRTGVLRARQFAEYLVYASETGFTYTFTSNHTDAWRTYRRWNEKNAGVVSLTSSASAPSVVRLHNLSVDGSGDVVAHITALSPQLVEDGACVLHVDSDDKKNALDYASAISSKLLHGMAFATAMAKCMGLGAVGDDVGCANLYKIALKKGVTELGAAFKKPIEEALGLSDMVEDVIDAIIAVTADVMTDIVGEGICAETSAVALSALDTNLAADIAAAIACVGEAVMLAQTAVDTEELIDTLKRAQFKNPGLPVTSTCYNKDEKDARYGSYTFDDDVDPKQVIGLQCPAYNGDGSLTKIYDYECMRKFADKTKVKLHGPDTENTKKHLEDCMFADCMGLSTLRVGDDYTLIDYRRDMCGFVPTEKEAKFYPGIKFAFQGHTAPCTEYFYGNLKLIRGECQAIIKYDK